MLVPKALSAFPICRRAIARSRSGRRTRETYTHFMIGPRTTVYFDGACPLCRREIGLLKRLDRKNKILFRDIAPPQAAAFCPLPQQDMLARFHVRRADGVMLDGAAAFLAAYAQLPGMGWMERLSRSRTACRILNVFYAGFLKIRPGMQWIARLFKKEQTAR